MGVIELRAKSDSQLVTSQVAGEFQTKDPQLLTYLNRVRSLFSKFDFFELTYVPREQNSRAGLLSKLASTKKADNNRTIIQETIATPSTEVEIQATTINEEEHWS
ncbi:putative gag polyprotein, partial [Trifolium medium]|nr:putative gag polyprotein [Trifolium medium]